MEGREKDIQYLCKQVIEMTPDFYDNPNGAYQHTCPMCNEILYGQMYADMSDIKHSQNCGYLIAKDLSSGFKNQHPCE